MSYTRTQKSRAQSEKHCRRRGASGGQKTRGCIEGENPGRRRYWGALPLEQKVERKDIGPRSFLTQKKRIVTFQRER